MRPDIIKQLGFHTRRLIQRNYTHSHCSAGEEKPLHDRDLHPDRMMMDVLGSCVLCQVRL